MYCHLLNPSLYTDVVFIIFLFVLFENISELASEARAVNKSPVVYILSLALDGLSRENRGSVNRLPNPHPTTTTTISFICMTITKYYSIAKAT